MRIVARSLARLGPGATPVLVTAMSAQDPAARAVAAEILGLGGAVTAVGVLASHALHDPDDDVRIRCARALGRIGVPSGLTVLERCLDPDEPLALRAVAARAIGDIGGRAGRRRCSSRCCWTTSTGSPATPPGRWAGSATARWSGCARSPPVVAPARSTRPRRWP